jgi:hypothetical protein
MSEVQEMQEQFSAEDRDVRVGAGPWTARCEGHIARHASDARTPGGLLFARFLFGRAREVGRTPQAGEGFRVVWRGCISIESLKTQSRRL